MTRTVIDANTYSIDIGFKWRSSDGRKVLPENMRTTHIFYTIRMIWNNRMPVPVPDNPKFYTFDKRFYDDRYLALALIHLWRELKTRKDLPPKLKNQLKWMRNQLPVNGEVLTWVDK